MASAFFSSALTAEKSAMFRTILHDKSVGCTGECRIWTGPCDVYGYGIYRTTVDGKRLKLLVHRLMYFAHNSPVELDRKMHVSHVCHNKKCINPDHLAYESAAENNSRKICQGNGECTGHRGSKRCVFPDTVKNFSSALSLLILLLLFLSLLRDLVFFGSCYSLESVLSHMSLLCYL